MRLFLFILISAFLAWVSRRPLKNRHSHGFYRFFAFEAVVAVVLLNHPYWFDDPFCLRQGFSWLLLVLSIVFVLAALALLRRHGGHEPRHAMPENLRFENTVHLVEIGIYRYVRHPMYSSLFLLAWGACLKQPTLLPLGLAAAATLFLWLTAKNEEQENLDHFGPVYCDYRQRSKMFIPYLF